MVCRRPYQSFGRTLTKPQEPLNGDHGLSLPSMPPEILSAVVDLAGSENLPALRLASKHLCAIANSPFATLNFSERRHVQSAYSMNSLIEITTHPFFGRFVKSVIISGSRPQLCGSPVSDGPPGVVRTCSYCKPDLDNITRRHPDPNHVILTFEQLRDRPKEAFSNIRLTILKSSLESATAHVRAMALHNSKHIVSRWVRNNAHPETHGPYGVSV
jgi:hypothetical protein